ncbi:hypothetical protein BJ165DRAFT_1445559 [Panaeolus papilionaceus]|nr:hypothetical protein BJ165DRAFT_1445559 [Panaeolus papilionaceus]
MPTSSPAVPRYISYPIRSLFTITEAEEQSQSSNRSSAHYTDCESTSDDDSTVFESESEDHTSSARDSLTPIVYDATPPTSAEDLITDKLNYLSFIKLEGVVAQKRRFGDKVKLINHLPRRAAPIPSPTIVDKSLPLPPPFATQDLHYWKSIAESSHKRCEQLEKTIESQQASTERLVSVYENTVLRLREKLLAASSSFQAILKERDELREQLEGAGVSGGHVEVKRISSDCHSAIETPSHSPGGSILPVSVRTEGQLALTHPGINICRHKQENEALAAECLSLQKLNARLSRRLQSLDPATHQIPSSQTEELRARLTDALSSKKSLQEELNHSRRLFVNSQRRIKYLMEATYHHLEADQELSPPPKPPTSTPISPNPAVVQTVKSLNDYIGQSSSKLVGSLERNPVDAFVGQERARRVLGDRLTGMLERRKSRLLKEENAQLLRVVMDVFLVHWTSSIINGCYPRPKKLFDELQGSSGAISVSGSSSSVDSKLAFSEDGIFALISSIRSDRSPVDLHIWLRDIYSDFALIMSTLGLQIKQKHAQTLISVLQTIIDKSYELRCALAQREQCGYLETIAITSDTEFSSSCMSDIYRNSKCDAINDTSRVLGTCSMGLQQCPPVAMGQTKAAFTPYYAGKVVLKPGVALRSAFK